MNYFFWKAIRLSFRYKWTIALSIANAMLIACLWSATIAAVYPFVEIVFEGKTLRTWIDDEVAQAAAQVKAVTAEIDAMRGELAHADVARQALLNRQIALRENRLAVLRENHKAKLRLKPWVDKWGPATPFGTLVVVIALLMAATVLKGACLVLSVVLVARIAGGTIVDLRRIFFRELLRMDQAQIDRIGTTNLMTMLSHNVGLIQAGLMSLYGRSLIEPLKMISCLVVAAMLSWQLLLASLIFAPLGFSLVHMMGRRMRKSAGREIEGYAAIFQTLLDTLTGIKLVKIFTRERRERRRFKYDSRSLYHMAMRISLYDSLLRPITELMGIVTLSTAILCGAYLVLSQQTHLLGIRMCSHPLGAAELFTFFAMLSGVADPGRKMTDIYNVLVRAGMASQGLFQTFETPPSVVAPAHPKQAPLHSRSIRFDHVTFGYVPGSPVVRDFHLEVPYGQTIALVGVNGCGKSTVTNLLARFYDPDSGDIYLDDVNLRDIRPRQLRKQLGIVTQDSILFRGTVWKNIRYADLNATPEQVAEAAALAHVTDFIDELPRKFQSQVGDGGNCLSGGQRQRVALARAILSNPRIFILDEATSQMDVEAEGLIHASLRDFLRQRTTILITHRPATLMLADRVVVMRAGRIIDDQPVTAMGESWETFAELIAKAA